MTKPKRSRFEPGGAPGLRLTERDVAIFKAVARYRVLDAEMIGRVLELSGFDASGIDARTGHIDHAKKIRDRLTELFHGGFLSRPRAGFSFAFPGSEPIAYAIGAEGVRLLGRQDDDSIDADAIRNTRNAGREFLQHQLLTNEFRIALQESVANRSDLALALDVVLHGDSNPNRSIQFSAEVTLGIEHRKVGIVPDLSFAISDAERTHAYFVEIDRETEPAVRNKWSRGSRTPTLSGTSILKKMLGYGALKSSGTIEKNLGWRNFKVLFVCEPRPGGGDRIRRLQEITKQRATKHTGLFLFASAEDITRTSDILRVEWRDANGNVSRLDLTSVALMQRTA